MNIEGSSLKQFFSSVRGDAIAEANIEH